MHVVVQCTAKEHAGAVLWDGGEGCPIGDGRVKIMEGNATTEGDHANQMMVERVDGFKGGDSKVVEDARFQKDN